MRYSTLVLVLMLLVNHNVYSQEKSQWDDFFHAVQMNEVFKDSKTFIDCTLKKDTAFVLKKYRKKRKKNSFNLKSFVNKYFEVPKAQPNAFESDPNMEVTEHIEKLWDVLSQESSQSKGTLIGLPNAYVVPGGRFREVYYWDSYFTMLGLIESGRLPMAKNMVDNFAHLINEYGFIPNGNRTYYLNRSQPPFFSLMVQLIAEHDEETTIADYLPQMEKEYSFWMEGRDSLNLFKTAYKRVVRLPRGEVVNRYWSNMPKPRAESYKEDVNMLKESELDTVMFYRNIRAACESGWDFSSRWLPYTMEMANIHTTEIAPIDLNCLLYHLETMIAKGYKEKGDAKKALQYTNASEDRKLAIQKYFWFGEEGFFMDYSYWDEYHTGIHSLAGVYPLVFGIANDIQALSISDRLENEFLKEGGLVTTLNETGEQWDSPNGWAPLQWMAVKGLRNYDLNALADIVTYRWIQTVQNTFKQRGKILEKYNVVDPSIPPTGGEYPSQDGFGWTNGVYLKMMSPR